MKSFGCKPISASPKVARAETREGVERPCQALRGVLDLYRQLDQAIWEQQGGWGIASDDPMTVEWIIAYALGEVLAAVRARRYKLSSSWHYHTGTKIRMRLLTVSIFAHIDSTGCFSR